MGGCLCLEERCGIPSIPSVHRLCKRLHAQSKAQKPKHLCLWCIGGCLRLLRERHSFCTLAFLLHLALIAIISIPLLHLQKARCGLMYGLIFLTCASAHRAEPRRGPCEVQCFPIDWFNVSTHTVRMSLEMNTGGGKSISPPTRYDNVLERTNVTIDKLTKPSTQPNCASPPPSAPVSPLSTIRLPPLLVLVHHLFLMLRRHLDLTRKPSVISVSTRCKWCAEGWA